MEDWLFDHDITLNDYANTVADLATKYADHKITWNQVIRDADKMADCPTFRGDIHSAATVAMAGVL